MLSFVVLYSVLWWEVNTFDDLDFVSTFDDWFDNVFCRICFCSVVSINTWWISNLPSAEQLAIHNSFVDCLLANEEWKYKKQFSYEW